MALGDVYYSKVGFYEVVQINTNFPVQFRYINPITGKFETIELIFEELILKKDWDKQMQDQLRAQVPIKINSVTNY